MLYTDLSARFMQFVEVTGMKLITLYLPEPYLEALDKLVDEMYYPHRAEAIRVAIRDLINVELRGRRRHGKVSR